MDEDLYDEFGNLIGDPFDSDAESSEDESFQYQNEDEDLQDVDDDENRIIVQEDKNEFSSLTETFGDAVETIIQEYDNQDINVPLVEPEFTKRSTKIETKKIPRTTYSTDYLAGLLDVPLRIRNVSLVGGLNSGKTSILDLLILETHQVKANNKDGKLRYTDNTKLEIERGLTLKLSPMTLLLQNLDDNSLVCNIVDTPGHSNFLDEVAVAQRLSDISIVVVDVVEGLTLSTKKILDNAILNNLQIVLLINKIDRLILELKLPVLDSFFKIRNVIDEFNTYIQTNRFISTYIYKDIIFSPELNNVLFTSTLFQIAFNLKSFAKLYFDRYGAKGDYTAFSKRLWGDVYYDPETNKFSTKGEKRSFVHFILEPIYKLTTQSLTKEPNELQKFIQEHFAVKFPKKIFDSNSNFQFLIKNVFKLIFGSVSSSIADVLQNLNSPESHTKSDTLIPITKVADKHVSSASPSGPLIANVVKITDDNLALVRIYSGKLTKSTKVKVLGENFRDDDDDFKIIKVEELYISGGRYKIPIDSASVGSIVLVGGIENIFKSGTIVNNDDDFIISSIFKPIDYLIQSVFKVVIEPSFPSELPKLLEGLRTINKTYPSVEIKVEESGEHVIFGSGELYLDSLLFELRDITKISIKVSDPITKFAETVLDQSFTKISIKSTNEQNSITIIAEPLDDKLARDVESGKFKIQEGKRINKILREEFGWDSLEARSLWSFGPTANGPNALLDDTISENENDAELLKSVKESIIQGFQWSCREGPLADEPIRNVKFKIIDFELSDNPIHRGNAQIIPMVRKACYAAILISNPKLMEPVYAFEIISKSVDYIPIIDKILDRRRGAILKDEPIGGCQLYRISGFIPVIDSIGFETDVRVITQGGALISFFFDKWSIVPGDPLDKDLIIPKLRPASIDSLARDLVVKTRKRKGLIGEPSLAKYIDQELVDSLKELGLLD